MLPVKRRSFHGTAGFYNDLRRYSETPIAVGFGISQPEHVKAVWQVADGAIVGSAIVREIEDNIGRADLVERVATFTRWLKAERHDYRGLAYAN